MINNKKENCRNKQNKIEISENMRAKEVANYLGIGLSTVWLYAKQGKITAYKLSPRVTIFKKDELDAFIKGANSTTNTNTPKVRRVAIKKILYYCFMILAWVLKYKYY